MTYQQLINEIKLLTPEERVALMEFLMRSYSEEVVPQGVESASSLGRVRGMLKSDGPPPSDEELRTAYTDFLIEKYA